MESKRSTVFGQLELLVEEEKKKKQEQKQHVLQKREIEKHKKELKQAAFRAFEQEFKKLKTGSWVLVKVKPYTWQPRKFKQGVFDWNKDKETNRETLEKGTIQFEDSVIHSFAFRHTVCEPTTILPVLDDNVEETQKLVDFLYEDLGLVFHAAPFQ